MAQIVVKSVVLAIILLAVLQPAGVYTMNEQKSSNCTVQVAVPAGLEKYLVKGAEPETCSLSQEFTPDYLESFISKLAARSSDIKTAKFMLILLYDWALSADNKNTQEQRVDKIKLCIEKITYSDAHEELTYWFNKCANILPKTSSVRRAKALDLVDNIDIPIELKAYPLSRDDHIWSIDETFSITEIPGFIKAIISISPQMYSALAHITFRRKALSALCRWAIQEAILENRQKKLTAIKQNIDIVTDQATKKELTYWFKKGLSYLFFIVKNSDRTETLLNLLLDNGAYLKSRLGCETLFSYPTLNDTLYKKLESTGISPNSASLWHTIAAGSNTAFDTLLRHSINIHARSKDDFNHFAKAAIDFNNNYALRRLFQKGIDINQKNKKGQTLLEYANEKIANNLIYATLLGQQPQNLPLETLNSYAYNPDEYLNFITIKNHKDLKKWLYDYVDYKDKKISNAFIDFGTTQQFKDGVARYIKNRKRFEKLTQIVTLHEQKQPGVIYAKLCACALNHGADMGFFRLLSLSVQQQIVQRWMFEKGRKDVPENMFLPNREAQQKIFNAFKKSNWPIGEYEMGYVKLAFVPLVIQNHLKKTLNTGKPKPALGDITVICRGTSPNKFLDKSTN